MPSLPTYHSGEMVAQTTIETLLSDEILILIYIPLENSGGGRKVPVSFSVEMILMRKWEEEEGQEEDTERGSCSAQCKLCVPVHAVFIPTYDVVLVNSVENTLPILYLC